MIHEISSYALGFDFTGQDKPGASMTTSILPAHWPVDSDWTQPLTPIFESDEFRQLMEFVAERRETETVYPAAEDVFRAFAFSSLADTRVVILGQDPYHGPDQAHGLSFSVGKEQKLPPSLRNIFKELASDLETDADFQCGELSSWASQGVLLLTTVLTVEQGQANSHRKKGWEQFTDFVIELIGGREQPAVFILWGKPAAKKRKLIGDHHTILESAHPSPLSAFRGFFGSKPFSKSNEALRAMGQQPIDWLSVK